jgi:glycosyltransferase involved in cell wall biosynthesis
MQARPRLLFVSPQFLFPADAGGKIRTTGILRAMKGGAFDVTLALPAAPDEAVRYAEDLRGICDRVVCWPAMPRKRGLLASLKRALALFGPLPVSAAADRSAAGQQGVAALLAESFDVVVSDFVHSCVLFDDLPPHSVLFTHNVEAEIFARHARHAKGALKRAVWRSQRRKMLKFEARWLPRFDKVIAVSERDLGFFLENYGVRGGEAIATGVDFEFFGAGPAQARPANDPRGGELVFTGSMDWPANIDAMTYCMDAIWPLVVERRPEARLTVVGRNPPTGLIAEARRRGLNWQFTGLVEDIRPFVRDADLYIVPLRVGSGTRIKIYEAMAMRRPVVSTYIGVEGLPLEAGAHYRRADHPQEFAAEILRLLDDPEDGYELAEEAYNFILKRFSNRHIARRFEEICGRAMGESEFAPMPAARKRETALAG